MRHTPAHDVHAAPFPLSYGQQGLWLLQQLHPQMTDYNTGLTLRIRSPFKVHYLKEAFQQALNRHDMLRARFAVHHGEPMQRVEAAEVLAFAEVDAHDWLDSQLKQEAEKALHLPFNLECGPLFRVFLFRVSATDALLLVSAHHIVTDLWSLLVVMREVGLDYRARCDGTAASVRPPIASYRDFTRWQRDLIEAERGRALRDYWRGQLEGAVGSAMLRVDYARAAHQTPRGALHFFSLPTSLTPSIHELAAAQNCTPATVLLCAYQLLLHRYTRQNDLLVGTLSSGRTRPQFHDVVGYFVNPLVIRSRLQADASLAQHLQSTRRTLTKALEAQEFPLSLVARAGPFTASPAAAPFQALFSFHNPRAIGRLASGLLDRSPELELAWAGLDCRAFPLAQQTGQFDIVLEMLRSSGAYQAALKYDAAAWDAATIERMSTHFVELVRELTVHPEGPVAKARMLTDTERGRMLRQWNSTARELPPATLAHHFFERQAASTPEAVALICGDEELTYREVDTRANAVARWLRSQGIGADSCVGLSVSRSPAMVIGLLGILKAGSAYVPLDPELPAERLEYIFNDAGIRYVVTDELAARKLPGSPTLLHLQACNGMLSPDAEKLLSYDSGLEASAQISPRHLAYVTYTSGSTGRPKGVMVEHGNLVNFLLAMDERLGTSPGTWLALTSISFDISVLELLWPLGRGFRVVVQGAVESYFALPQARRANAPVDLSLFFFGDCGQAHSPEAKYRLLIESAKFADEHGLRAVWTPERHFHAFGGLYPDPALTAAALATITRRIAIRAGSVVAPLHDPIRLAEAWAAIDNLSQGRVGVSFASGWNPRDFALAPGSYAGRKEQTFETIATFQKLWRGEEVTAQDGHGNTVPIRTHPRPIQQQLPIWLTAAGHPDTFQKAGEGGFNLLTHLLGQSTATLARHIEIYRAAGLRTGTGGRDATVTLMLHTFLGADRTAVRARVREAFRQYLRSSADLFQQLLRGAPPLEGLPAEDAQYLIDQAFDRYFDTGLFGTVEEALAKVLELQAIGVDEIACLIDFGLDFDTVMGGLKNLQALHAKCVAAHRNPGTGNGRSIADHLRRFQVTHMQCTPSVAALLADHPQTFGAMKSLRMLLVGGEPLPADLARRLAGKLSAAVMNMYGPTETTIWSTAFELDSHSSAVCIGRPIANTEIYVLDEHMEPVPIGVPGRLFIGGAGVARGYLHQEDLTRRRFIANPLAESASGGRIYDTGDIVYYRPDGNLVFVGREDRQLKIRGHRIEPAEIEAVLRGHRGITSCCVAARTAGSRSELVAYIVPRNPDSPPELDELYKHLRTALPEAMVPAHFVALAALPLSANGKVDLRALPAVAGRQLPADGGALPTTPLERQISRIWEEVLSVSVIRTDTHFFRSGGHSLLATQMVLCVRRALNAPIPLRSVFENPTLGEFVAAVLLYQAAEAPADMLADALREIEQMPDEALSRGAHTEATVSRGRDGQEQRL